MNYPANTKVKTCMKVSILLGQNVKINSANFSSNDEIAKFSSANFDI